ncbi:hypothetical protein IEO21_03709 [Rhodonia placenta]|uniref:AB hydrolase-1 domain-containing protein n=1 Tax=Rhodonia placenta TaxID=104341 RepID=A0A8H7P5J7_9APHY|nr:hypothetical protein IEO21_03709 [Postia placenta]
MQDQRLRSLPDDIATRTLPVNDLDMHIHEAGDRTNPLILLLHGFPELAYSWRKVILPVAQIGYHVVAPDQRGFGRTTMTQCSGDQIRYEDDWRSFHVQSLVRDILALAFALGHRTVAAVIGHDLGSIVAAHCALIRPDVFHSVVMMSAPFPGPPSLPFDIDATSPPPPPITIFSPLIQNQLAGLNKPLKYYMTYFAGPDANHDLLNAPEGLHQFLRAYFHTKSADWSGNNPHPLRSVEVSEMAKLPCYYMMPLHSTMPQAVAPYTPSSQEVAYNRWLPDSELAVYTAEYQRTGFQGGLNWYRSWHPEVQRELALFAERRIDVPAMFLSGEKDWGMFQLPGAMEKMKRRACSRMDDEDVVVIEGAGHWVQQEQPEMVVHHIRRFLHKVRVISSFYRVTDRPDSGISTRLHRIRERLSVLTRANLTVFNAFLS